MRNLVWLVLFLVPVSGGLSWAGPAKTVRPPDPAALAAKRVAQEFLRGAPRDARHTLCTAPGARPALIQLGQLLQRGKVDPALLLTMVSNPHAKDHLVTALRALSRVDGVEGIQEVVQRLGSAREQGGVRGATFELVADACLKDQLRAVNVMRNGKETDGVLKDGTVVEMKDRAHKFISKVRSQIKLRVPAGGRSMLVVPRDLEEAQIASLRRVAAFTKTHLSVVVADAATLTGRTVLVEDGRNPGWLLPAPAVPQRPLEVQPEN